MSRPLRVGFLVRDVREGTLSANLGQADLPRERHWGLPLLQQRSDLRVIPWYLGTERLSLRQRILARLVPRRAEVFWSRPSPSLAKRLTASQEQYDVVISTNNTATATLLALRRDKGFQPRLACLLVGVADWLQRADPETRARTLDYLAVADRLLALGTAEVGYLRSCSLEQVAFLPYGVDTDYWAPIDVEIEDFVFAVGSDPLRDFDTLIKACPYPLRIMTRARHLITVSLPANVTFVQGNTSDLRSLYARARVVVVPLKDGLQPSGQNTILQALSMAKPVIVTKMQGTWTDKLQDNENCVTVPPYDSDALRTAITALYNSPERVRVAENARRTVKQFFDVQVLGDGLVSCLYELTTHIRAATS